MVSRYEATGTSSSQRTVVMPAGGAGSPSVFCTPLEMTCQPCGTVAVTANVAVSAGCSLTGNHADAPVGSPATNAPPESVRYQPPSPRLAVPPPTTPGDPA